MWRLGCRPLEPADVAGAGGTWIEALKDGANDRGGREVGVGCVHWPAVEVAHPDGNRVFGRDADGEIVATVG